MTGHTLNSENRQMLSLTAVADVKSFDEDSVIISLEEGGFIVKGSSLKISRLDLDEGVVEISGNIDSMTYTQSTFEGSKGLFRRLMK